MRVIHLQNISYEYFHSLEMHIVSRLFLSYSVKSFEMRPVLEYRETVDETHDNEIF